MRPVLLLLTCLRVAVALGQPPPGYYNAASGLSGAPLKQALYTIISGHTVLANSALWDAFAACDARPDGYVWDIYSDQPGGTPAYLYSFVVDQCGTYNSEGDCFNREHTFPLSWFNSAAPMSTDVHHIHPTDAWVNQRRANWPYGTVASPTWSSTNGGKLGPCSWPGCSGTAFEPIDAYKGDLARAYFYMMTRYLPFVIAWSGPMTQGDDLAPWAESLLLDWHLGDPVSPKEVARNNAVYALQNNRNPYIDNPLWVEAIWGPNASAGEPPSSAVRMWVADGRLYTNGIAAGTSVQVSDALGRVVLTVTVTSEGGSVELPLLNGLYFATCVGEAGVVVVRFVR
ncbi:MAG: endonuclease [Flavobacteriales bacterium]|nr:endonuclease [Flavobacteriales bacterium]